MASLLVCVEGRDGHLSGGYTEGPVSRAASQQVQREFSVILAQGRLAQPGRALPSHGRRRGFKSLNDYRVVTQTVRGLPVEQVVADSTSARPSLAEVSAGALLGL